MHSWAWPRGGGGGYNPWSVGRCWAGVWAALNGIAADGTLAAEAQTVLRALRWRHRLGRNPPERWFTTLADPSRPGLPSDAMRRLVDEVMAP
jgi:acetoin utilization protein AcuC